eukprot:CAMPEP_0117442590 /NCGR_PEP_ID=MMETSP0759-20121206/4234_1 /TAXON_ID=63605 /ORGANISM="Percolomonas cosmopolitus, Strain WS" /LENGTH=442 /DNA_ID=CAMNT_0005234491 /DNA_START=548 /DNA_END=1873 /DNA_ORIENTATION=+
MSVFESRIKMPLRVSHAEFFVQWYAMKMFRFTATFCCALSWQYFEFASRKLYRTLTGTRRIERRSLGHDTNGVERFELVDLDEEEDSQEDEEDEEDDDDIPTSLLVINAIVDHFSLAFILRHMFFRDNSRLLVFNGMLTHFLIETVYRTSSSFVDSATKAIAWKDVQAEKEDSNLMWKVLKELIDADTYTSYGREYVLRHFRDSTGMEGRTMYIVRMALAYFAQNYHLMKQCGIFGRFKSILKTLALDVALSVVTYPLSVVKFSQIQAAGRETFWESSALHHAKQINQRDGYAGFYRGFTSYLMDATLRVVGPVVVWGITDWAFFQVYKYFHPRSGLPTENPLWQSSSEACASGSSDIIDFLNEARRHPGEDVDVERTIELKTGISSAPTSETDQCCVCMERQRSCVLYPCKHLALCKMCAIQIDKCPLCREPIESTTRIFW